MPTRPSSEAPTSSRKRPLNDMSSSSASADSQVRRTILVVGLSPACFETEVHMVWPKKKKPKDVQLVWVNTGDAPAKLPGGWEWDEVHRCCVSELAGMPTEKWGELLLIMGAGTSVQDFASLKQDSESMYPFDKELLQASSDVDIFSREGRLIMEPLCVQTLRFMAGLRKAFLERHLPPFHQWMHQQASRVVGVITFNIDSLEFLALEAAQHDRIVQFHGNITQLTTVESLALPYSDRPIADREPAAWSNLASLELLAAPSTPLSGVALDLRSDVFMGCRAVGASRSLRQANLDREVVEASHRICRGEETGLAPVALARANSLVKEKMKQLYVGNCVFTGEHNDAKVAKCATALLRGFVNLQEDFARLEADVRKVNVQRGVGPQQLASLDPKKEEEGEAGAKEE